MDICNQKNQVYIGKYMAYEQGLSPQQYSPILVKGKNILLQP